MNISESIIHQIRKEAKTKGEGSVRIQPRATALPIDEVLRGLCSDLLDLYGRLANNYGTLGNDPTTHVFTQKLRDYFEVRSDLQVFSAQAVSLIAKQMEGAFLSNGGYSLFLRYEHGGDDFMLVAMLKLKPGAGIDEGTLSLEPTLTIDLSLLHEAARINLTRWSHGQEPYLSFIKGRSKSNEVTDYFRDALACQNFTSSSHHTDQVIRAADLYVNSREDLVTDEQKREERLQMRKRLHDCFSANKEEVTLLTLAASVMPLDPQSFVDFVRTGPVASDFQINDTFSPHPKTYNRLRRIAGKIGGSISVAFDVADVEEDRVYYDEGIDGLILKSPPEHIKQAASKNVQSNPEVDT